MSVTQPRAGGFVGVRCGLKHLDRWVWHLELALWEGVALPRAGSCGRILRHKGQVSS